MLITDSQESAKESQEENVTTQHQEVQQQQIDTESEIEEIAEPAGPVQCGICGESYEGCSNDDQSPCVTKMKVKCAGFEYMRITGWKMTERIAHLIAVA